MGLIPILSLGLILVVMLVKAGEPYRSAPGSREISRGWVYFLALGMGGMSGLALLGLLLGDVGSMLLLLLLPALCVLWGENLRLWATVGIGLASRQELPDLRGALLLFLMSCALLAALGWSGDSYILWGILLGGVILAAVGWAWSLKAGWRALSYLLLTVLLLLAVWQTDRWEEWDFLPGSLSAWAGSLNWIAPGLGIVMALNILGRALADERRSFRPAALRAALLILPICLLVAWQAVTASAWDVATDGLGGIFLLQLGYMFGGAAASWQAWRLPSERRLAVWGLALLILLVISSANAFGTFGLDGTWGNVPRARTARRAEQINQAVLRYHQDQGSYPQALSELAPGYLLYLPTPFIIPRQDWCYQGGADYYRLGYVYREYFSMPASVKIHASSGEPPAAHWPCAAEAAKYPGSMAFSEP